MVIASTTRAQAETTDRGDRRQRLAAETERGNGLQVIERGDLAGGVARHGQRQLVGSHADAIVADADQADAALFQVDVDAPRTGIERVLDQLLDHGRRPLDHLAGSDLVDEGVGELLDWHRAMITVPRWRFSQLERPWLDCPLGHHRRRRKAIAASGPMGRFEQDPPFPRRRESMDFESFKNQRPWIPACAGMTIKGQLFRPTLAGALRARRRLRPRRRCPMHAWRTTCPEAAGW